MAKGTFNKLLEEVKRRNLPRVGTVYAISSWVLIQVVTTVFPHLNIPEWVVTLIIILILIGFPVVLILAWFFEFSPNSPTSSAEASVDAYPRRRLFTSNVAMAVLILVVIGQFIYFNSSKNFSKEETSIEKSVAVIPFENLTNDSEMESFSDGMTEEIIDHLSKIASLKVTSRTSIKIFKNTKATIAEIASKLLVNHILSGTIRKSGNHIRIAAQLIDAKTDKQIWSEDFDYLGPKDFFNVETEVSVKVAKALKAKLTEREIKSLSKNYTDNIQAYKYYLKGKNFWDKRTAEAYDSAEANFRKAIDVDPQYALAYSGLADCYVHSNFKGLTQMEAVPIAREYVLKALQIDSTLCEAITNLGFIQSHFDYDWESGKKTLRKAIRCNPNYPLAHMYLSNILTFQGNISGIDEAKKTIELDPLSATVNFVYGRAFYLNNRLDEAIVQLEKNLKLYPAYHLNKTILALAYLERKDFKNARKVIDQMPEKLFIVEYKGIYLAYLLALENKKSESEKLLTDALKTFKGISDFRAAQVWVALGNYDEAIKSLERSYEQKEISMIFLNVERSFSPIRSNPRFQTLLKKMNFTK